MSTFYTCLLHFTMEDCAWLMGGVSHCGRPSPTCAFVLNMMFGKGYDWMESLYPDPRD